MSIQPYEKPDQMTAAEAVLLCRFAKACCPQQAIDQYTPDAWHELLRDLTFDDCKAAIVDIVKTQPFVAPAEIRDRVRKLSLEREYAFLRRFEIEYPSLLEVDEDLELRRTIGQGLRNGTITEPAHMPSGVIVYDREGILAPLPPEPGSRRTSAPKGLLDELRRKANGAKSDEATP